MPEEPQIKNLSHEKRQRFFIFLVLVFIVVLPMFIFYTTGYRIDFGNDEQTIVSTGGIYVTTDNLEVDVYLDANRVDRPRLFRNAYYIQNIAEGDHRIVVQHPGLYTWVKVLPIYPHLVSEVAAFNMPRQPQLRPVTEYITTTGIAVYEGEASTSPLFVTATATQPYLFVEQIRPARYVENEEYVYVASLFGTSTPERRSVFEEWWSGVDRFGFATATNSKISSTTEVVVERNNLRLIERDNELYARWIGQSDSIPYYFCLVDGDATTTAERYGVHVAESVEQHRISTTTPLIIGGNRVCRQEIRIDRKWQDIYFYDFFPDNPDLVLLQLDDGLYVTEIDDRAWQNTQLIYPGNDILVVVENGIIYVKDDDYYFEVVTEIETE